jgi:hypothetical protein
VARARSGYFGSPAANEEVGQAQLQLGGGCTSWSDSGKAQGRSILRWTNPEPAGPKNSTESKVPRSHPMLVLKTDVRFYRACARSLFAALCLATATIVQCRTYPQTTRDLRTKGERPVSYDEFGPESSANCLILLHGASGLSVPLYKDQAITLENTISMSFCRTISTRRTR